jgi:hypothetical protein
VSTSSLHERQHYATFLGATVRLTAGSASTGTDGASGRPSPLSLGGRYAVVCPSTGIYIRQGSAGVEATTADRFLAAGQVRYFNVDTVEDARLAVLRAQGVDGFVYITRVDSLDGTRLGSADAQKLLHFTGKSGSTTKIAVGAASVRVGPLVHGARYEVVCPEIDPAGVLGQRGDAVWLKQGGSSVVVDPAPGATLGMPLAKGAILDVNAESGADYIAVLSQAGGNGSYLFLTRIDSVS